MQVNEKKPGRAETAGKKIIDFESALALSEHETRNYCKTYWNGSRTALMGLLNFDRQYARAQGTSVWDGEGNEYLDFLGGYGSLNVGHNHPKINEAVRRVEELPNVLQASINPLTGALAKNLAEITPGQLQRSFFCSSGAEAVEAALKLARLASGRKEIVYCKNSFHGKTFGALSVTGRDKYQKPFQPLLPGCRAIPYGDIAALEDALKSRQAAAFIVEPIQGEGGINVPPPGYLKEAERICRQYGTLMIVDEVQTGMGRTGKMFACEHEGVEPDIMCLSKSLGGGVMPLGACISTDRVWKKAFGSLEGATLHSSTFEGNTRAMAAGLAAIEVIYKENLIEQAREKGEYFLKKLRELKQRFPLIKDVRGKGLMIGLEFADTHSSIASKLSFGLVERLSEEFMGSLVAGELLNKYRIITAYTLNNPNVIRLEPPLVVTREQIDAVLEALESILKTHKGFFSMAKTSAKTILKSLKK